MVNKKVMIGEAMLDETENVYFDGKPLTWNHDASQKICNVNERHVTLNGERLIGSNPPKHDDRLDAMVKITATSRILKQEEQDEKRNDTPEYGESLRDYIHKKYPSEKLKWECREARRNMDEQEKGNDAPIEEYPKMSVKFNDIINNLKRTETELITALSFIDGYHLVESVYTEPSNHIEAISIISGFSQRISMLASELRNNLE